MRPDLSAISKEETEKRRKIISELRELNRRAKEGDKKAMPALRKILDESPDLAWRLMDLARIAEHSFIQKLSKDGDLATRGVLERQLKAMREEVAGEDPSPLERLLVERVVATWLQIQLFEALYGYNMFENLTTRHGGDYYQKHLDRAYRRHLSAIRALAQVRKLGPAVQINIAEKQVVAGSDVQRG
jgi:hypothetical protein